MDNKYVKIHTTGCNAPLKVTPGHFATNHAHINYYLDMTTLKTRLSEAQEIARSLSGLFLYDTVVDTIVCLEGTQVVGSFQMCIRDSTSGMYRFPDEKDKKKEDAR